MRLPAWIAAVFNMNAQIPVGSAHFNPRAPCGARRYDLIEFSSLVEISIHAPLAGRDFTFCQAIRILIISIHAPLAGRDKLAEGNEIILLAFQSTRPLRGATYAEIDAKDKQAFQSTRPLRGATKCASSKGDMLEAFQSTRPLRGATGGLTASS